MAGDYSFEYTPLSAEARGLDEKTARAIDEHVAKVIANTEPLDAEAIRRLQNVLWPPPHPIPKRIDNGPRRAR